MHKSLIIALGIALVIGGLMLLVYTKSAQKADIQEEPQGYACTMEAKICPDGSSVGRQGPNCEFAACPSFTPSDADGEELDMGVGDGSALSASGSACIAQGGAWNPQYTECVGVSASQCQAIGGTFDECASACRHNPNAEVCTMQCVQVCAL